MVFGLFSGFYYWWPKVFGKMLNEKLGSWNFWFMVIGMNLTFGPMHILGLQGQPRRMYVWTEARAGEGFFNLGFWNMVSSIGSFILAVGVLFFIINVIKTTRNPERAPLDPWDARTLEWITTSPPKVHNFDRIPVVHHLDEFFHRKYEEDEATHTMKQVATGEELVRAEEAAADADILHNQQLAAADCGFPAHTFAAALSQHLRNLCVHVGRATTFESAHVATCKDVSYRRWEALEIRRVQDEGGARRK
jgi:cytochrome c oxidase subunit 1